MKPFRPMTFYFRETEQNPIPEDRADPTFLVQQPRKNVFLELQMEKRKPDEGGE